MELGLETCGLATYGLGLDDFSIRGLGLGKRGLGLATIGLDYISGIIYIVTLRVSVEPT